MDSVGSLAVVIAAYNESERLPLLLADLQAGELPLAEVLVVDGVSSDRTAQIAGLAGARVLRGARSRGEQLAQGASDCQASWLLFLHGDARLPSSWDCAVAGAMAFGMGDSLGPRRRGSAWYFRLVIDGWRPALRLVEWTVVLRSRWRQLPYGDQGLLVSRQHYQQAGGFASLPLMEDLEFIQRLNQHCRLRCLGVPLRVDGRRWMERGVWAVGWSNWLLRRAWRRGVSCQDLATRYYDHPQGRKA